MPDAEVSDASDASDSALPDVFAPEGPAAINVPRDPGFQGTPPNAWTFGDGVTLDPNAPFGVDPGRANIATDALCTTTTLVSQAFTVPPFSQIGPLAMRIVAPIDCHPPAQNPGCGGNHEFIFRFGHSMRVGGGQSTFCLGEAEYGPVDFSLSTKPQSPLDCTSPDLHGAWIDRIDIVPDPTCPPPATLPNGDFEHGGSWTEFTSNWGPADIRAGVGVGGSHALVLDQTGCLEPPIASVAMSAPIHSVARPAISLKLRGLGSTPPLQVFLDRDLVAVIDPPVAGGFAERRICVPSWAKGIVSRLSLTVDKSGYGHPCTDMTPIQLLVDDVAFVSEPTCPDDASVIDGDFERADSAISWARPATAHPASIAIVHDPDNAHGGDAFASISVAATCQYGMTEYGVIEQSVTVPSPVAGAGPAVSFYYALPSSTTSRFYVGDELLAVAPTYTKKIVCIHPRLAGTPYPVVFGGLVSCGGALPAEAIRIDDVTVTTDPSCPAAE